MFAASVPLGGSQSTRLSVMWITLADFTNRDDDLVATKQHRLALLSRKQFGLVTRAQLLRIGYSSAAITRAARRGELARFLSGVWRVTSAPTCWEQRPLGAVLCVGGRTAASHITSAYLQELVPRSVDVVEITTERSPTRRPGMIVHRSRLPDNDIVNVRGIPCTNVYRTLVDVCGSQPESRSEVVLDAALRMGRVEYDRLRSYVAVAASRRLKGSASLGRFLDIRGEDEALSESDAESLFARIMRRGGLTVGLRQVAREGVRNGRVDFYYPDHNLVVEIDGRKFHAGRREQIRDRRYDNELNIRGDRVLRLTWADLQDEEYLVDLVARALGNRTLS
jgi:very-short-patch-repair endonuclease